ncbi:hypothetical protein FRX31_007185 [Thalictrum thalictroides]|uniref:Uncharacterized protein n=1 Tax=Thalictrum thalictroides TaxID=46969 RepID=A0A7J6X0F5_THATH|nr:hypothetical protein FRX31_007185 [Thalictrum thalictroides]
MKLVLRDHDRRQSESVLLGKGLASGSKGREEAGGGIGVIGWETASPNTIFDTGENNNPQLVKARLKQWAQLVACSVRHSC